MARFASAETRALLRGRGEIENDCENDFEKKNLPGEFGKNKLSFRLRFARFIYKLHVNKHNDGLAFRNSVKINALVFNYGLSVRHRLEQCFPTGGP